MAFLVSLDPKDIATLAQPMELMRTPQKTLTAPNRIAYQPMEGNDGLPDGNVSESTIARYIERAAGKAGIEFVEALAVSPAGKARGDQLILHEATKRSYQWLVKKYRASNAKTPILFQLTHSGRFSVEAVTPYPLQDQRARLLTDADMAVIQEGFVKAAKLAFECGADGIDFKHCHGYLCGAMLGPANRKRPNWSWGGDSLEERARFFVETLGLMQKAVSPDKFFYALRLSAYEGLPGGFGSRGPEVVEEDTDMNELKAFCQLAERAGIRLIDQSSGVPERTPLLVRQTDENPTGFYDHERRAAFIKQAVKIPVVGSGYSYLKNGRNKLPGDDPTKKNIIFVGAKNVREGKADFVGLGRQCLSEPYFADKIFTGRFEEIHWDTSCNKCAISLRSYIHAGCVTYDQHYTDIFVKMKKEATTQTVLKGGEVA